MSTVSVALALVQPVGTPEVWSGSSVGERLLGLLFQRHADVYFRPLLQAPTIATLQWRTLKLGWRFTAERRAANLISLMTRRKVPSDQEFEEVYAHVQRQLEQSWFSEETRERIDYVVFTMLRIGAASPTALQPSVGGVTPGSLFDLFRIIGKVELYVGAALLALREPSLVKNPLVLNDVAARASAAVDELLAAFAKFGIEVA